MVAFVWSNFDENRHCLGLDNNRGLLSFEQSWSNESLRGACIDSYLNYVRRIWWQYSLFLFYDALTGGEKALFLHILKLNSLKTQKAT